MKRFGIVSYNIYCNFTNYGSALQSWALHQTINKIDSNKYQSVLVDYCPDILADKDPLNPIKNMWDKDSEARKQCELSLPAIRINYEKFNKFYNDKFNRTIRKYTPNNFESIIEKEKIDSFICGSDTIFCLEEFSGYEPGYYACYDCMRNNSISYAASFGDSKFDESNYPILLSKLNNFKAVGIREEEMVKPLQDRLEIPVARNIDPTLLLTNIDYDSIATPREIEGKYLLLYTRRYNPIMEDYAIKIAKENNWEIVEISLRAENANKGHIMKYDAGVEEFLSLVKHSEFLVTNSFHGLIFGVQYQKPFIVFSREQANSKISELLRLFGIKDRLFITGKESFPSCINYTEVHNRINEARIKSLEYLKKSLKLLD